MKKKDIDQDRRPNFRDSSGKLFLVRCYACEPGRGRENWAPAVASGECAWCGWKEDKPSPSPSSSPPKNAA